MSRQGKGSWVTQGGRSSTCQVAHPAGSVARSETLPRQPHPRSRTALLCPRRGPDRLGQEAERTLSPTWRARGPATIAPGAGLRVQGSAGAATPAHKEAGGAAAPDLASGAGVPGGPTAHARGPARQCACAAAWELQHPECSAPHRVLVSEGVGCVYRGYG